MNERFLQCDWKRNIVYKFFIYYSTDMGLLLPWMSLKPEKMVLLILSLQLLTFCEYTHTHTHGMNIFKIK